MSILRKLYVCSVLISSVSLSGCGMSVFANRDATNANIQDITIAPHLLPWNKTMLNTFATTASRRMVLAKFDDTGDKLITCAEPPPDVGEAFASAVADTVTAKAPIEGVPIELSNAYARAVSTQIASLVHRTQGLQLYRDAMHGLCVDRMNGWFGGKENSNENKGKYQPQLNDKDSYESLRLHYFDKSVKLIEKELDNIKAVGEKKAGDTPTIDKVVDTATKLLNAAKTQPAEVKKP